MTTMTPLGQSDLMNHREHCEISVHDRSLNHCFTTWFNPHNKREDTKKGENGERKKQCARLSRNLMDVN